MIKYIRQVFKLILALHCHPSEFLVQLSVFLDEFTTTEVFSNSTHNITFERVVGKDKPPFPTKIYFPKDGENLFLRLVIFFHWVLYDFFKLCSWIHRCLQLEAVTEFGFERLGIKRNAQARWKSQTDFWSIQGWNIGSFWDMMF